MTLSLYNTHPIQLTCTIDSSSNLQLHHGNQALGSHDNSLFNELPDSGPYERSEVEIADFTHGSQTYEVHVWEPDDAGGVQKWTRTTGGSCSGAHHHYGEKEVLVVAVPSGVTVPEPTSTAGPPAPGTSQTTVKVKIRRHGAMPDD
jgi:hypothetical protein